MRKVSRVIAQAFINGERKAMGNTMTDGNTVYLHGNAIFKREDGKLYATLAGWPTVTTRERLNALLNMVGSDIYVQQKNHATFWRNLPLDMPPPDSYTRWVEIR